jgi:pimeloyl-ACP methyl ester carboxylesterase
LRVPGVREEEEQMLETTPEEATAQDLRVAGYRFRYVDKGSGAPILFVHGSQSDYRTWHQQIEAFRKSHRVIAYSRRFHRPNEAIPEGVDYSMAEHVDDLEKIIRALDLAPVRLVGHSYGAFVSLILALRRPDLVSRLVLAEPPVITLFVSDPPRPLELLRLLLTRPRLAGAILKFGATAIAPARAALKRGDRETAFQITGRAVLGPETVARLSPERLQQARDNLVPAELLGSGFLRLDPRQVAQLRPPVLLIKGGRTRPLFRLLTEALHEMLPRAIGAEVPNASHLMHEDNVGGYNAVVADFLGN